MGRSLEGECEKVIRWGVRRSLEGGCEEKGVRRALKGGCGKALEEGYQRRV